MTTYITPDNKLHDDAEGFALTLPTWPQDARLATQVEVDTFLNPPVSVETLKLAKNAEINESRLKANLTTFQHNGKAFACDQLSRGDIDGINGYVGTRGALPPNWIGGWKAVDNSIVAIADVNAWNAFYDSMIAQGQANFAHSQTLKSQLAAATTKAQVNAIAW
jgi:hypothetical protein